MPYNMNSSVNVLLWSCHHSLVSSVRSLLEFDLYLKIDFTCHIPHICFRLVWNKWIYLMNHNVLAFPRTWPHHSVSCLLAAIFLFVFRFHYPWLQSACRMASNGISILQSLFFNYCNVQRKIKQNVLFKHLTWSMRRLFFVQGYKYCKNGPDV